MSGVSPGLEQVKTTNRALTIKREEEVGVNQREFKRYSLRNRMSLVMWLF